MTRVPRVLLIAPPWRVPHLGSLALATLGPVLRAQGFEVDELHAATLFPTDGVDVDVDESYSRYLFSAALRKRPVDDFVDEAMAAILRDANMNGVLYDDITWASLGADEEAIKARFRRDVHRANACLDRSTERMLARDYDVVGFSLLFDDQVPAALELARRIKAARPSVKVMFGGAACFEEQADGLIVSFPEIDAVCHTEGEVVIGELVRGLVGEVPLANVAGIAYRDDTGALCHTASPPLLRDLDSLPVPDYRAFIAQLDETPWARLGPRLLFETSRGCWWGQKSLCTFCGLNAEGLSFRSKTPARAYDEIAGLYTDYPTAVYLQATDNILDMKYLTTVFPRLAQLAKAPDRPLRMFYEVKSNMKWEQVEAMALAGVEIVQPGIESFHDDVLKLMRKGNTALGQVQFIKWAYQAKIDTVYNVLLCNPGELAAWYDEMIDLLPSIRHLPPPTGVTPMLLERFSPYFRNPAEFDITNVRPKASYQVLYPPGADLARIAYLFDFDHPLVRDEQLVVAYRRLTQALKVWMAEWREGIAYYVDRGGRLDVLDRRDGTPVESMIAGAAVQLYLFLDRYRARPAISAAFPQLGDHFIDCLLLSWQHRRWIVRSGDKYVAVLPRKGPRLTVLETAKSRRVVLPMAATAHQESA
ncbi:MAG: RiPP maturation radical SAM C-methyltransferase [Deltaproteobacteria bacterium]|nr:RiPP maturation radical SAM C-methyltransferase [Deltaproteobacteria bacterium]